MRSHAQPISWPAVPRALGFDLPRGAIPYLLDLLGGLTLYLALMRFGIAELGWITFAPFLAALHRNGSRRHHAILFVILLVATNLTVLKIVTEEIPAGIVPMFAIPLGLSYFLSLVVAGVAHRQLGPRWGIYAFPAMMVGLSWVQYTFTPGASWGALAHTQAGNLPLMQLVSVTGIGGLSFLVALGSSLAAAGSSAGLRAVRADVAAFGLLLLAALIYGELRLGEPATGATVRVGSVVSPTTFREFRAARQNVDSIRAFDDELFARSSRAVDLGAQVVVWNEVATVVTPDGEANLVSRAEDFAKRRDVMLMMAYVVLVGKDPLRWINKYRLIRPDGTTADEYRKRHPVPGDPGIPGTAHAAVVPFEGAKITGAICYDYSFPAIALDNAHDGAGLVLLPASDWRGIDPLHGRMAVMNAVAAGLSLARPVRAATSLIADPYGRLLGTQRADSPDAGVMVAAVPTERRSTLYARTGEIVPLLAWAFCAILLARLLLRRSSSLAVHGP